MQRNARQSRPQLVCVLADNSGSMAGAKAEAATCGIREMLMNCQSRGPRGPERSYFRMVLIKFGSHAQTDPVCNMRPVRQIDPASIVLKGDGGGTNMTAALELAYDGLERYARELLSDHPERAQHPLPLVMLFSDGYNNCGDPLPAAEKIKGLKLDGTPISIAAAGVAVGDGEQPDEALLRRIASPNCYVHVEDARVLTQFLAEVGSSGASSPQEVATVVERVRAIACLEG